MNGYLQNGDFSNNNSMEGDNNQHASNAMMMMGQDGMSGGMIGGQSLDEIVNLNAKAMRRQSMPHQYGGQQNNTDTDMRRMSMMEYAGTPPAGSMSNFQFDPSAAGSQQGMMSGRGAPAQQQQQRNIRRHHSNTDMSIQTSFPDAPQSFNPMMQPPSAYQSPAHPQTSYDMSMNSPYVDNPIGMQMDYVDQNMGNGTPLNPPSMNMFNQTQHFNQGMMQQSPMHYSGGQTPMSARPTAPEPGGASRSASYHAPSSRSANAAPSLSRRQSLQNSTQTSPVHDSISPIPQVPTSGSQSQQMPGLSGPMGQPPPGPPQDQERGKASQREFDGMNGPVHPISIDANTYNPNNQRFDWDVPEGGWPSTLTGRPHMNTTYKNVYSSSGFDMLGVLVSHR